MCGDGIKNGDETGVDCGGSCPADCNCLWRQTAKSDQKDHTFEMAPYDDLPCDAEIDMEREGYCDCGEGPEFLNYERHIYHVTAPHEYFTCSEICEIRKRHRARLHTTTAPSTVCLQQHPVH